MAKRKAKPTKRKRSLNNLGKVDKKPAKVVVNEEPKKVRQTTKQLRAIFFEHLMDDVVLGNISVAAKLTGISRQTVYDWRRVSKKFKSDMDAAVVEAKGRMCDEMRDVLLDVARNKGKGAVAAAIFLLKTGDPENYSDRVVHAGDKDEPIEHEVSMPNTDRWLQKHIERKAKRLAKQMVKEHKTNAKNGNKLQRGT